MLRMTVAWLSIVMVCHVSPSEAGIPEPDTILYGHVCLDSGLATDQSVLTIVARAHGTSMEVGRYTMGDLEQASNCEGEADCYVLRIRLESVPNNTTASGRAVVLAPGTSPMVQIFVLNDSEPEVMVAEVSVARGLTVNLDLRASAPTADLNGDSQINLLDHNQFVGDMQGPLIKASPPCNPADQNGDGFIDLRDAAALQRAIGD